MNTRAADIPVGFHTTRWDLIQAADPNRQASSQSGAALEELFRIYRPPVLTYLLCRIRNKQDAEDLTQEFFSRLSQNSVLRLAQPGKGRFRSFLLTSLRNFLTDWYRARGSLKRGGHLDFVRLDSQPGINEPEAADAAAQLRFDYVWAQTVVNRALQSLHDYYSGRGELEIYQALLPFLETEASGPQAAAAAGQMRITRTQLHGRVHRLRTRFAAIVRQELVRTVTAPHELELELRYLLQVLAARR